MTTPTWEVLQNATKHRMVLWVNNLYPIKVYRFDIRSVLFHIPITKKLTNMFPEGYTVLSIEKRIKEGGAYVHVETPDNLPERAAFEQIDTIFRTQPKHFHAASRPARVDLVLGRPLVEDMDRRLPSDLIKITPKGIGATLDADDVYRQFRRYGKIHDIVIPPPSKDQPSNHMLLYYYRLEGAIAARNCLHKASSPTGTVMLVEYVMMRRMGWIKEQFDNHPRVMFPLVGLLATILTVVLFDPLRTWFMERKLKKPHKEGAHSLVEVMMTWEARGEEEENLAAHLNSPPKGITVLTAPKGAGKSALVNTVLRGRENVVYIDFSQVDAIPDADFINHIATSVGYFPNFSFMSQASSWLELLPLGTGKGTFSWNAHSQLQNILYCLERALRIVAESQQKHPSRSTSKHPPVVVLDGVLESLRSMENKEEANMLLDMVIHFAVTVSQKKSLSHVLIISHDHTAVEATKKLASAKGGSKIHAIRIGDIKVSAALEFVRTCVNALPNTPAKDSIDLDLQYAVTQLGGRLSDLETFVQKVAGGATPRDAISQMLDAAISEIRTEGFGLTRGKTISKSQPSDKDLKWSQAQLWKTIRRIAAEDVIAYDDLLFNVFGGNVNALNALLNSNLVRISGSNGGVTAYSPLYRSAFVQMTTDKSVSEAMDIVVMKASLEEAIVSLGRVEDELLKLKSLKVPSGWRGYLGVGVSNPTTGRRVALERHMAELTIQIDTLDSQLKQLTRKH
eukprot:Phypoly_transcript_03725.p1 GENE.Phypoly_transcript_03725~~Phypoly_transcript_03725.p1  ORF type:complete len:736 (+),score=103.59 Phypoly_transcript_03725:134-2341(+)